MAKQVIVVGAGISGLTCAYRLKQKGIKVTLLESGAFVGGVIQTHIADGFLCEAGPNSFQNLPEIIQLVEEIGIGDELVAAEASLPRYIFFRGKLRRAPMGPGGLFSTPLLSFRGKMRVFAEPWSKPNRDKKEESLAEFVTRRFGSEVMRNFAAPFVSGVYAGDPHRLSAQSAFPMLVEFERKHGSVLKGLVASARNKPKPRLPRKLCSFRKGLHTLPQCLAERIGSENIHLKAKTVSMAVSQQKGQNLFTLRALEGDHPLVLDADAVVLAGSAYRAAELIEPVCRSLAGDLAGIEYPPLAGVCLAYRKSDVPHSLKGFGFLVPRGEGVRLLGCIWSSSLFPGRAPEGAALLTVFAGGATDPEAALMGETGIVELVRKDLRTAMGITATPRVVSLNLNTHAIPQYTIGHEERLRRIEGEIERIPGLFLAGNYLRGVSVPDCVTQAIRLARRLAP